MRSPRSLVLSVAASLGGGVQGSVERGWVPISTETSGERFAFARFKESLRRTPWTDQYYMAMLTW